KNQVPAWLEKLTTHYADSLRPIDDLRSTGKYRQQTALRILAHFLRRELA
ncbi:MAG TPA: dehydrogenase, partial [Firmicutes bacterium]|nr:dehydrogenase [Bacillota bacterium]